MIRIAVIQFPGTNCEYETKRAIDAVEYMMAKIIRWNEVDDLSYFDGIVIPGGFSYEDRSRAGIIAAQEEIMQKIVAEARKGKPVLGICNGAQVLLESGLVPDIGEHKQSKQSEESGEDKETEKVTETNNQNSSDQEDIKSKDNREEKQSIQKEKKATDQERTQIANIQMALAPNKQMKDGKVIGTGFYNTWVYMKNVAEKARCAFTHFIDEGEILKIPIAHAEGRFTTKELPILKNIVFNQQVIFRYCDERGVVKEDFPINPNGSLLAIAAVCNKEGNVMAMMPHPERSSFNYQLPKTDRKTTRENPSEMSETQVSTQVNRLLHFASGIKLFKSMKHYIETRKISNTRRIDVSGLDKYMARTYEYGTESNSDQEEEQEETAMQFLIELIITDDEAVTVKNTLKKRFPCISELRKQRMFIVKPAYAEANNEKLKSIAKDIILSGELVNTNKENVKLMIRKTAYAFDKDRLEFERTKTPTERLIITINNSYSEDFLGISKRQALESRHQITAKSVVSKTRWYFKIDGRELNKMYPEVDDKEEKIKLLAIDIAGTYVLYNPHAQSCTVDIN